ncbi:MAG: DUF4872 domain-containing protein [Chloroflexi bacterium]|nr:DUF4872 domain-containing protein [Chloroflexota bacterium]
MPTLNDFRHFNGLHWETGFLANALAYQGVRAPHSGQPLSEALLMGITGGICAGYFVFEYTGHDPHLHFLTRYPFSQHEPGAIYERLGIPYVMQQTPTPQKATANLINALAKGSPAVVWVDMVSLPYNDMSAEEYGWAIFPLLVYGLDLDKNQAQLADRACAPFTVSADQLAAARARIAKMKHRMMTIGAPDFNKLPAAVLAGIRATIDIFTGKPPVATASSFGFAAYQRWADMLVNEKNAKGWGRQFAGPRLYAGLTSAYKYIEVWFTGGRGGRHLYADFLDEAADILNKPALKQVGVQFRLSAEKWDTLAQTLLPDHIAPFKEARDLMQRSYQLFITQGSARLPERQHNRRRLAELAAAMKTDFPLTAGQEAALRAQIRGAVLAIHDAETVAIEQLAAATA